MNRSILLIFVLFFGCNRNTEKLKILFAGDLMLDRGTKEIVDNNGADYLFSDIKTILNNSDFTIANFECTASETSLKPANKTFTFRANPQWLAALRNNHITHVTLANNHSLDFGAEGIKQTAFNLKHNGINVLGYRHNGQSACEPVIIEKSVNKTAIFSSCFLKLNDSGGLVCNENAISLSQRIKLFKQSHPAFVVYVCLHWGKEMELKPSPEQVEQAHLLINAGVDAIIGHHPHVVQTIEVYKGKYIFYSIGNFIFDNNRPPANKGILANFSVSGGKVETVQIIPFNIVKSKPKPMNTEDSEKFMHEISVVSPTVNLQQVNGTWKAN